MPLLREADNTEARIYGQLLATLATITYSSS